MHSQYAESMHLQVELEAESPELQKLRRNISAIFNLKASASEVPSRANLATLHVCGGPGFSLPAEND